MSPEPQSLNRIQAAYRLILAVIAISAGLITILSLVIESDLLGLLRGLFVEWTVIVIAFAIFLGVVNVLRVHAKRIHNRQEAGLSLVLILAFLAVFIPGIMPAGAGPEYLHEYIGPTGSIVDFFFRYVQRPLQATLFSLMGFFVVTAAWRAFRKRSVASLVMLVACVLVLLGSIQLNVGEWWALIIQTRDWVMNVPVLAGSRGILLGIVLGTIVAGVRLLVGVDRPYSE